MSELQFTKEVNASKLREEIQTSSFAAKISDIHTVGELVTLVTKSELTSQEATELNSLITGHTKENASSVAKDRARKGIQVGIDLMAEIAAHFLQRKTLTNAELLVAHGRFLNFQQLLYAGFFSLAKVSLGQIQVDALVPQALLDQINSKMQRYIDSVKNG